MKHVSRPPVRTLVALAAAAAGLVAVAAPASAAVTDHEGPVHFTYGQNCDSVLAGYPYVERATGLVASSRYDDAAPPRAGEVFYVSVQAAAVGDPYPCVGQKMRPDILLPDGVSLAISPANPITCVRWEYGAASPVSTPETALCPTAAQPPQQGGHASFGTSAGESWDMPTGTGWEIRVPVVSSVPGSSPAVAFTVRVLDAYTNPLVTVTAGAVPVQQAATPTPTPTPTPGPVTGTTPGPTPGAGSQVPDQATQATAAVSVAPVVRLDRTRGRVPARSIAGPVGSTSRLSVAARVSGRWVKVGSASYDVTGSGTQRTAVRVARKWRRALDGRRVAARLVLRVTSPGGDAATVRTTFAMKG